MSVPPTLDYCAHALVAGHQLMCLMVETLAKTFEWEPVHSIASLMDDFRYAWPDNGTGKAAPER